MCWKLVDDVSGVIICRSTIYSAIEPGTANLQVDPIEPRPDANSDHEDELFDAFTSLSDFDTLFLPMSEKGLVDPIPASTKSKTRQDIYRGEEHLEDTNQPYFQSELTKANEQTHCYSIRSKSREANAATTKDDWEPTSFVYFRDDGETSTPV